MYFMTSSVFSVDLYQRRKWLVEQSCIFKFVLGLLRH